MDYLKITDGIAVGGQPSDQDLQQLKQDGFRAVVNLRREGEPEQPMTPDAEGTRVEELGMAYFRLPVRMEEMDAEKVDAFTEMLERLPQPVYVHCKGGTRAGVVSMAHVGVKAGMTGDQVLEKAQQMGFRCDMPAAKAFVKEYVDRRR